MKYRPTPRDLFNPPPQAIRWGNRCPMDDYEKMVNEIYPGYADERRTVLLGILDILREHEEWIGGIE